jgi:hypothetical protein
MTRDDIHPQVQAEILQALLIATKTRSTVTNYQLAEQVGVDHQAVHAVLNAQTGVEAREAFLVRSGERFDYSLTADGRPAVQGEAVELFAAVEDDNDKSLSNRQALGNRVPLSVTRAISLLSVEWDAADTREEKEQLRDAAAERVHQVEHLVMSVGAAKASGTRALPIDAYGGAAIVLLELANVELEGRPANQVRAVVAAHEPRYGARHPQLQPLRQTVDARIAAVRQANGARQAATLS